VHIQCDADHAGTYDEGSPITHYDFVGGPPAFFANGGNGDEQHGDPGPELIDIQGAKDFDFQFSLHDPHPNHLMCLVPEPRHATKLLSFECDDVQGTRTVLKETAHFLWDNRV
jgi:hypothetical protein